MIRFSPDAENNLDALLASYEERGRPEATAGLFAAIERAAARIERAPDAGLPAPRPYPGRARAGRRLVKEGPYWVTCSLWKPLVITGLFHERANIPGRAQPHSGSKGCRLARAALCGKSAAPSSLPVLRRRQAVILRYALPFSAALLLAACVNKQAAAPAGPNLNEGIAAVCNPSTPTLVPGAVAQAEMKMGNDGGWCAVRVADAGQPFVVGLVHDRPAHGRVVVRAAGNQTFLDYVPAPGYSGPDSFTTILRPHEKDAKDSTVHVTVLVAPRAG